MVPAAPRQSFGLAVFWLLTSMIFYQGMIGTIKALSPDLGPYGVGFWRTLLAIPMILPFVLYCHRGQFLAVKSHRALASRASAEFLLSLCFFMAIATLPLALAVALILTVPIWITLGAGVFLGERPGVHRWAAVALGFLGMLVIVDVGGADVGGTEGEAAAINWFVFLPILGAMFWAASNLILRRVSQRESVGKIMLWMVLLQAPLFMVAAWPTWQWPDPDHWPFLLFAAACGTLGQYGLTLAHRHAEASKIAPLAYGELVIAAVVSILVFAEYPALNTYIGGAIIAVAGIYIAYRERQAKQREKAHKARAPNPAPAVNLE
ncbi:MAG: DMT family transporter [Pseudomonadota bacterium]